MELNYGTFLDKKSGEDATEMIKNTEDNKKLTAEKDTEVREALKELNSRLEIIGNLVHDTVPIDNDEVTIWHIRFTFCKYVASSD